MPVATGAWGGSRPILSLNSNGNSSGSQSPKGEEVVNDRTSGRVSQSSVADHSLASLTPSLLIRYIFY